MADLRAIAEYDPLDTFLESVLTLVDESKLHFEQNGFRITAVDPANVASVRTMLGPKAFESYDLDERAMIGCNLNRLDEALGFSSAGDVVGIETDVKGVTESSVGGKTLSGFLELETGAVSHDIALIDPDSIRQEPDMPDLDLPATIVLEGRQLTQAVRAADTVSDHVTLEVDEDAEVFRALGKGDTDSTDVEYGTEDAIDFTVADARSMYSIEYLKDMVKPIPSDAEVTVRLGRDFPLEMKWTHAEGYGSVTYLLAPRIDSD